MIMELKAVTRLGARAAVALPAVVPAALAVIEADIGSESGKMMQTDVPTQRCYALHMKIPQASCKRNGLGRQPHSNQAKHNKPPKMPLKNVKLLSFAQKQCFLN